MNIPCRLGSNLVAFAVSIVCHLPRHDALAQSVPPKINYQGQLLQADGTPLSSGEQTLRVSIHDRAAEGSRLWGPQLFDGRTGDGHSPRVRIETNGLFNIAVGEKDTNGVSLADGLRGKSVAYLEVAVGESGGAVFPRQEILSAPFALHAMTSSNAAFATTSAFAEEAKSAGDALTMQGKGWDWLFADNKPEARILQSSGLRLVSNGNIAPQLLISPAESSGNMILRARPATTTEREVFAIEAHGDGPPQVDLPGVPKVRSSVSIQLEPWFGRISAHGTLYSSGRLGIGTTSPSAPLEVLGSSPVFRSGYSFFERTGAAPWYRIGADGGDIAYSIVTSHAIGTPALYVYSDRRIKKDVSSSNPSKDLESIRQLSVVDYRPVDYLVEGTQVRKGFVAQEVQKIIPEAVGKQTRFIPDIYALADTVQYSGAAAQLRLALPKAHRVKTGDRVRIFASDTSLDLPVMETPSEQVLVLGECRQEPNKVFVYGKQTADFLSVDYDRIFTTGIGALQELDRQLQAKEERLRHLEEKVRSLESIEARLNRLEIAARQTETEARLLVLERKLMKQDGFDKSTEPQPDAGDALVAARR